MKKSKRGEREPRNYKTINKMAVICSYLFITAINVNGLKCSNKKYGLAECILKHKNQLYKRFTYAESEEMEKILLANGNLKKAGVAMLISDKTDFKPKTVTRYKRGH